jgi:hypothetical protein
MALPRPVLIAVLGLALCAAAFMATRGAKDPSGAITASPTPAPASTPAPAKHHPAKHQPAKVHKAAPSQSDTEAQAERALRSASQAAVPANQRDSARRAPAQQQEPAKPAHKPATATKPGSQQTAVEVTRALGKGEAVVFFFTHHGAADDQRTRQAVEMLRGRKDVMVVQAGLKELADYRPVLAGAGVSQVPSIVIVHADKPARLLEGYVDPGTLRQNVADALR